MTTPNINLKSLEFNDIKNELVTYIKSKSDFSDFDRPIESDLIQVLWTKL